MAAITYTPNFQPPEYVDNVDRVQAGGPKGFNAQFQQLQAEFAAIAAVVAQISSALNALGQKPPPTPTAAMITPTLVAASATGWQGGLGVATKPAGATSAWGVMSVDLIDGVTIQSFRVTGRNLSSTGALRIGLQRQSIVFGTPSEQIVQLNNVAGDPVDQAAAAAPALASVDTKLFKYFITAQLDSAQPADIVLLNAFQITFLRP